MEKVFNEHKYIINILKDLIYRLDTENNIQEGLKVLFEYFLEQISQLDIKFKTSSGFNAFNYIYKENITDISMIETIFKNISKEKIKKKRKKSIIINKNESILSNFSDNSSLKSNCTKISKNLDNSKILKDVFNPIENVKIDKEFNNNLKKFEKFKNDIEKTARNYNSVIKFENNLITIENGNSLTVKEEIYKLKNLIFTKNIIKSNEEESSKIVNFYRKNQFARLESQKIYIEYLNEYILITGYNNEKELLKIEKEINNYNFEEYRFIKIEESELLECDIIYLKIYSVMIKSYFANFIQDNIKNKFEKIYFEITQDLEKNKMNISIFYKNQDNNEKEEFLKFIDNQFKDLTFICLQLTNTYHNETNTNEMKKFIIKPFCKNIICFFGNKNSIIALKNFQNYKIKKFTFLNFIFKPKNLFKKNDIIYSENSIITQLINHNLEDSFFNSIMNAISSNEKFGKNKEECLEKNKKKNEDRFSDEKDPEDTIIEDEDLNENDAEFLKIEKMFDDNNFKLTKCKKFKINNDNSSYFYSYFVPFSKHDGIFYKDFEIALANCQGNSIEIIRILPKHKGNKQKYYLNEIKDSLREYCLEFEKKNFNKSDYF